MPESLPAAVSLRVPTDLVFVRPVRKMIEGLLGGQGWGEDDVDDVAMIVTEVVQNAIEHGSRADGSEWIDVSIGVHESSFSLDVADPGSGKDPSIAVTHDVSEPPSLEAERGRGLFLIHRLSHRFERVPAESGGLRVRVLKEAGTP